MIMTISRTSLFLFYSMDLYKFSLKIILAICFLYESTSYNLKCPDLSQWKYQTDKCTPEKNTNYQCLFQEGKSRVKGFCGEDEIAREGFKYVLKPNPDQVECSSTRYQPFMFSSHEDSQCKYEKSLCNEDGQVVANNGYTTSDRACRCDYRKGYVFVTPTKRKCSCIPSKEDCSCYHNPCPDHIPIMLADYRCVNKDEVPLPELILCSPINEHRISTSDTPKSVPFAEGEFEIKWNRRYTTIWMVFGLLCLLVFCPCLFIDSKHYVRPIVVFAGVSSEIDIATKEENESYTFIEGDNITLHFNVNSYFTPKSVRWFRDENEVKRDKFNSSATQRYTIDDVKPANGGTYKCIVQNCLRQSNLIGIFNDLPLFYVEKDYVAIKILSFRDKQVNFTVYIDYGVTFKIVCETDPGKKRLVQIINGGKLTKKKPFSDEDDPWTFENCRQSDIGQYMCISYNPEGRISEEYSFFSNLNVIDKDDTCTKISEHREDVSYIQTAVVPTILKGFEKSQFMLISGRKGSGKTKLCLEIASECLKKGIRPFIIDTDLKDEIAFDDSNTLYIIDSLKSENKWILQDFVNQTKLKSQIAAIRIMVTCRKSQLFYELKVKLNKSEQPFKSIDLDTCLGCEDKKQILLKHMEVNGISKTKERHLFLTMFTASLCDATVATILNSNSWFGYPLTVASFCKTKQDCHVYKTFNCPPEYTTDVLEKMYKEAKSEPTRVIVDKFYVLMHISVSEQHHLSLSCIEKSLYNRIDLHFWPSEEMPISQLSTNISTASKSMIDEYLLFNGKHYTFINPLITQALLSGAPELALDIFIEKGTLDDIYKFINYELLQCLPQSVEYLFMTLLCKRLVKEFIQNFNNRISEYISYWVLKGKDWFIPHLFDNIDQFKYKKQDCRETQFLPLFYIMSLLELMTERGKNMHIFWRKVPDHVLPYGILLAVQKDYCITGSNNCSELFSKLKEKLSSKKRFVSALHTALDEDGNDFFDILACFMDRSPKTYKIVESCFKSAGIDLEYECRRRKNKNCYSFIM